VAGVDETATAAPKKKRKQADGDEVSRHLQGAWGETTDMD
jgi:hypothetical protein